MTESSSLEIADHVLRPIKEVIDDAHPDACFGPHVHVVSYNLHTIGQKIGQLLEQGTNAQGGDTSYIVVTNGFFSLPNGKQTIVGFTYRELIQIQTQFVSAKNYSYQNLDIGRFVSFRSILAFSFLDCDSFFFVVRIVHPLPHEAYQDWLFYLADEFPFLRSYGSDLPDEPTKCLDLVNKIIKLRLRNSGHHMLDQLVANLRDWCLTIQGITDPNQHQLYYLATQVKIYQIKTNWTALDSPMAAPLAAPAAAPLVAPAAPTMEIVSDDTSQTESTDAGDVARPRRTKFPIRRFLLDRSQTRPGGKPVSDDSDSSDTGNLVDVRDPMLDGDLRNYCEQSLIGVGVGTVWNIRRSSVFYSPGIPDNIYSFFDRYVNRSLTELTIVFGVKKHKFPHQVIVNGMVEKDVKQLIMMIYSYESLHTYYSPEKIESIQFKKLKVTSIYETDPPAWLVLVYFKLIS